MNYNAVCMSQAADPSALTNCRNVTGQLYSTASISCANVQAALQGSDPDSPPAGINKLLEQNGCVQQEEALRSMLFAQLLTAQQQ